MEILKINMELSNILEIWEIYLQHDTIIAITKGNTDWRF